MGTSRPSRLARSVPEAPNRDLWAALGEELPQPEQGRPRDPYWEQGCHPDVVNRLWNELGAELPEAARAQAKGRPVLAHGDTDRIIGFARGTSYALWIAPGDRDAATSAGASPRWTWGSGAVTDLGQSIGPGWIWGRRYADEPRWVRHAYAAVASSPPSVARRSSRTDD
jgi:hypothetical protein